MLQPGGFFNAVAIDLDRELHGVVCVREQHCPSLVAVVVEGTLLIGYADSGEQHMWSVLRVFLSDVTVAFNEGVLEHA